MNSLSPSRSIKELPEDRTNSERLFMAVQKVIRGECRSHKAAQNFSVSESTVRSLVEQAQRNQWTEKELRCNIPEEMMVEIKLEETLNQCRGCRTNGDFEMLFSIHEEGLKGLFVELTGIEIKDDDPAPQFICESCRSQLVNFSMFRATCIDSNNYFYERMREMKVNESKLEWSMDPIKIEVEERPLKVAKKSQRKERGSITQKKVQQLDWDRLICNECDKKLNRKKFLQHWRYKHLIDDHPSTCGECSQDFQSLYKLEEHQRTEHGILKCFKCDRRATVYSRERKDVSKFLMHFKTCNRDPNEYSLECRHCEMKIATYKQLFSHESKCSGPTMMCHICSIWVKKIVFKNHMEKHSSEDFPCRTCQKPFDSKYQRNLHEKNICRVERVICHYCGTLWKNKNKLLGHIRRIHLDQKKLMLKRQCTVCGAVVHRLRNHMAKHTNERNYHCNIEGCGMSFRELNTLKKHQHSHNKTRPYNCTLCSTGYYQTEYLRKHYQRTHGIVIEKGQKIPYNKPVRLSS